MTSSSCICRRKRSRGSTDNHLSAFEHIKHFQDVAVYFLSCEQGNRSLIKVWYLLMDPKCCFIINVGTWGFWQTKYFSYCSSAVVTSLTLVFICLKVLWLLSFDDKNTLADAVDKYCIGVPPIQWLAWIPQLLTCLVGSEGKPLLNLISQVRSFVLSKRWLTKVFFFLCFWYFVALNAWMPAPLFNHLFLFILVSSSQSDWCGGISAHSHLFIQFEMN